MGRLGRLLDVLRIVVAAADDDHVLEPAGDEQLAVVHEAEVAGPQEAAFVAGDAGAEHLVGFLGADSNSRRRPTGLESESRRLRPVRTRRSVAGSTISSV